MPNFHVIILHFPIAFLTLYGVLEISTFKRLRTSEAFFYIKALLAVLGALSAYATLMTGSLIEDNFRDMRAILSWHENFADISTGLATLAAFIYLAAITGRIPRIQAWAKRCLESPAIKILALLILAAITLTGIFGGVVAFGAYSDPLAPMILRLFGLPF